MIEKFYVTQIIVGLAKNRTNIGFDNNQVTQLDSLGFDTFTAVNPNTPNPPPTYDTYQEAETWIKTKGKKGKWYQIQKFLMPH